MSHPGYPGDEGLAGRKALKDQVPTGGARFTDRYGMGNGPDLTNGIQEKKEELTNEILARVFLETRGRMNLTRDALAEFSG